MKKIFRSVSEKCKAEFGDKDSPLVAMLFDRTAQKYEVSRHKYLWSAYNGQAIIVHTHRTGAGVSMEMMLREEAERKWPNEMRKILAQEPTLFMGEIEVPSPEDD